jgi:glycosyltransferase involved in cell wall biosynthesis
MKPPATTRVSIVVPSRNAAATIDRTLASLVAQGYPNLEIICVDGASTDDTLQIIERYRRHISFVISEPDKNIADALNKGFRKATGDLVGWLCADDELASGALETFVRLFAENPGVDIVTGGCRRIFPDGLVVVTAPSPNCMETITMRNGIEQPSTLWTRLLHKKAGELDTSYDLAFDHELWCRFRELGAKVITTDKVLSSYHFSEANKTSNGGRKLVREMYRIAKTYGPLRGFVADLHYFLYVTFDLKGYFDHPNSVPLWRRRVFYGFLGLLALVLGPKVIKAYNWNFASKQERGMCWYR